MKKTLTRTNADGTPHFDYELDEKDMAAGRTVNLATGPIAGTLALSDGTAYDVTEFAVAVKPEHLEELQLAIHKAHHAAGRFLDAPLPTETVSIPG